MDTIKIENKAVKMVAHRGLSGIEKENTCSAFVAACNRATYFAVETDVHRTVDGQFVIFHDDNTARVGLDHVKKIVLDDAARRKELYEALLYALQNYEDPWNAAVQKPAVRREFELLEKPS